MAKKKASKTIGQTVNEQAKLKLGTKTRTISIPPMTASRLAVQTAVEHLMGLGWTREFALEMLATQLHENLSELKVFYTLQSVKKGGKR